MSDADVVRIEVYLLRPGCPPEHLRELVREITSAGDIGEALSTISDAVGQDRRPPLDDGVPSYEWRIFRSDGTTERRILSAIQ